MPFIKMVRVARYRHAGVSCMIAGLWPDPHGRVDLYGRQLLGSRGGEYQHDPEGFTSAIASR